MSETALTTIRDGSAMTLADTMTLGKVLAESGFFSDARGAAQAVAKILAGREMGFGPMASMTGVNIIQGRVAVSANLMAAAVQHSGRYKFRVLELDEKVCRIRFYEGQEVIGESSFSVDDARKAGTKNLDKFPRNMLFARAMSNGVKWFCPSVMNGQPVYTPEELGAVVDGETGEIINTVPRNSNTGPAWTPELMSDDTDEAAPVVEAQPAKSAPKLADVAKDIRDEWRAAALALAEMFPAVYEDDDGKPNYFRMRGALAKHGIVTVRADNLEAAVDILRSHANDKLAERLTEPLPGMGAQDGTG